MSSILWGRLLFVPVYSSEKDMMITLVGTAVVRVK